MWAPLLVEDLLRMLGMPGQAVLALSVGFVAWYLVKGLRFGRRAGAAVDTGVKFLAFGLAFVAVGSFFGWFAIDVGAVLGTGASVVEAGASIVGRFGDDVWRLFTGVIG